MVNGKRLLLVEDDNAIRETLRDQLQEEFFVVEAARGAEALKLGEGFHPRTNHSRCRPADMNGLDVRKLMRRAGINTLLRDAYRCRCHRGRRRSGSDWGANDYVTKPFKMGLKARIHAQLRQYDRNEGAIFTIGPYIPPCRKDHDRYSKRRPQNQADGEGNRDPEVSLPAWRDSYRP